MTRSWARAILDVDAHAGVAWWSSRDPRWASLGLRDRSAAVPVGDPQPLGLEDDAVLVAGAALSRVIEG